MKLDNQGSWNAVKFQTKLLVKRITAIHSVGVPSEKTSILEKFMNLLDNNFETLARLSNKTIGMSKSKFYEPQKTAKINLSETKTSSCVLKSAFLFLFIREKKASDVNYLSYSASLCYLQCFVLSVSSNACLQCLQCI